MEDRKRPRATDPELDTPPLKRQATTPTTTTIPKIDDITQADVEHFQKEALVRQLHQYRREKLDLEKQVDENSKRYHGSRQHLQTQDAALEQFLDRIRIRLGEADSSSHSQRRYHPIPDKVLRGSKEEFQLYLDARQKYFDEELATLTGKVIQAPLPAEPQVEALQQKYEALLLEAKGRHRDLEELREEKLELEERLENASLRYMVAEKKFDRMKSVTVAKIEAQATNTSPKHLTNGVNGTNGVHSGNATSAPPDNPAEENLKKEIMAVSRKQQKQLETYHADNAQLREQNTSLNLRLLKQNDEDVTKTEVFAGLKTQHEDVITRVNNLEALNKQLKEEAEKLQAERAQHKLKLESDSQALVSDLEGQVSRLDADLTRIRTARDELLADQQMRRSSQDSKQASYAAQQQLTATNEERLKALQEEIARLKFAAEQQPDSGVEEFVNEPIEILAQKMAKKLEECSMLKGELDAMASAYEKSRALAGKNVTNLTNIEERSARLQAEKSKADQKYFSAMKMKEARESELRSVKIANQKSSDLISQLKEVEASGVAARIGLERELAERKSVAASLEESELKLKQESRQHSTKIASLSKEVEELRGMLKTKDDSITTLSEKSQQAEVEVERLKVRTEEARKNAEMWKAKGLGNESEEYEALRLLALCNVCKRRFKNTAIKSCGHVFCNECIEDRIKNRARKCPNCNKAFGTQNDCMAIHL